MRFTVGLGDKIRKALGNAVADASRTAAAPDVLPSGYASLDYALGGGFQEGRLHEVYGESTVGKSLIVYRVLAKNQARNGVSVLWNNEEAYAASFFRILGGDPDSLLLYPNPDEGEVDDKGNLREPVYLEDVFTKMQEVMILKLKEKDSTPIVMGWDGIAATLPKACGEVELADANMRYNLAKAMAMSNACPRIHTLAAKTKTTIIATNQIRESIDPFDRKVKRPGGVSWQYLSSSWVEMRKGETIKSEGGEAIGHWIEGIVTKSRLDSALRKFRLPCYTRYDQPHPVYDIPLRPGIHEEEGLWEFLRGSTKKSKDGDTKQIGYFFMPDGKLVIDSESKGWFILHPHFGGQKFRRTDWLKVLEDHPTLRNLPKIEG
jgi:RecA/RadA recombinase